MESYLFLENRHPNIQVFLSLNKAIYSKDRSYRFGLTDAASLFQLEGLVRPKLPVGFPSSIDIVNESELKFESCISLDERVLYVLHDRRRQLHCKEMIHTFHFGKD